MMPLRYALNGAIASFVRIRTDFRLAGFVHQLNCERLCTDSHRVQAGQAIQKAQTTRLLAVGGSPRWCTSPLAIGDAPDAVRVRPGEDP
jgi:hypothetical protein